MTESESNINSVKLYLVSERAIFFYFYRKTLFIGKYEHKCQYHAYWEYLKYLFCLKKAFGVTSYHN